MTNEEIELKRVELSKQHGCPVHAMVFTDGVNVDDKIIGFLKEPPRFVKLRVMDKGLTSPITAASEVVEGYLIKDASDPRIWDEKPENDKYYIGATMEAYNMISMSVNQFKKK